jgi:putative glycosyltransferase (TIGR04372 family)
MCSNYRRDLNILKKFIILFCITIPAYLIIRIIQPFILVRFGNLAADRIGHLAMDVELTRCLQSKTTRKNTFPIKLNIYIYPGKIANEYLFNLWKKTEKITNNYVLNQLHYLNEINSKSNAFNFLGFVEKEGHWDLRILDEVKKFPQIPLQHLENGWGELKKFGLERGNRFVCLCVRDEEYLKTQNPNRDWTYHNYRDTKVEDYLEAAEALADQGYYVFRMGKIVRSGLISENKRVIDYANSSIRSDFLDIFLLANSSFTISTSTGPDAVSAIFRRPIGLINTVQAKSVSLGNIYQMYQPKFFKKTSTGKYLGIEELLVNNWNQINSAKEIEEIGLEIEDNTPVEIKEFVLEFAKLVENNEFKGQANGLEDNLFQKISKTWLNNLERRNLNLKKI